MNKETETAYHRLVNAIRFPDIRTFNDKNCIHCNKRFKYSEESYDGKCLHCLIKEVFGQLKT